MPAHKAMKKKAMPKGMHKMPGGMMMSDKEHAAMMDGKAPAKKKASARKK